MNNQTLIKKSLGLNKTAFTNTLAIFTTMQHHGESLFKTTVEQSPWLPGSSKDACLYWVDFYSKYLNNLKSMADQGAAEIERISLPLLKLVEDASPQTIDTEPAKKSPAVREKKASAKETSGAKMLPEKKPATQKTSTEKPAPQKTSAEKPAPEKTSAEKPAPEKTSAEKPAPQKTSAEKPAPQNTSAKKPAPQDANNEKPVTQDKPDVNKSNK